MRFQNLPIKRKLVGMILLISLSVLLLAAIVMLAYEFRSSRLEMAAKLSAVAEIITANSSAALVFDDPKLAHEILASLKAEPEIVAAALYDTAGARYAQYPTNLPRPEIPAVAPGPHQEFQLREFTLSRPVMQDERQVGHLFLKADYRNLHHRLAVYAFMLAFVLVAAGVLALFLSNLFESRISRPLLQLAEVARVISDEKDYSVRAVKTSEDEFGTLTDAFNAMLAQIDASDLALRENERRFREMIDSLPAAVYTTDAQGRLTHFNPATVAASGRIPEIGVDQWCVSWRLYHPDGRPMAPEDCPMAVTLREGRPIRDTEVMLERPDGTRIWVTPYPTPLRDDAGQVVGGINMLVDITLRKEAEAERTNLLRREREAREEAETVNEVARTLAGELDLEKLLQAITDAGTKLTAADFGAFFHNFEAGPGGARMPGTVSGASRAAVEKFDLPRYRAWFAGEGVVRSDDLRRHPESGAGENLPVRSFLAMPVTSRSGEILGGLYFGHRDPAVFTERDERLLAGIAAQAAIAIDNARLFVKAEKEIAERRQAEFALRESEARERAQASELRAIMEAVPALIWIARDQGRLITGNRASYEFLRLPLDVNASTSGPKASRPTHFEVLVEGRVLRPEEMPVQRAARGVEVHNLEEEVRFNDGTSRFLLGNATPLRDGRGEVCGAVAAFVDITERKRAEEALREREERYELVVAGAEAAIWDWDIRQKRVLYSPRWCELRGFSETEIGDSETEWLSRIHPDDKDQVMAAVQAHLGRETPVFAAEYRVRHKDGRWLWILDRGIARYDAAGRAVRMAGSETDITERKHAEETLHIRARQQEAVARLGELALRERNVPTVLTHATTLLAETLELEYSKVLELQPDGMRFLLRAGVGWEKGLVGHALVSAGRDSQAGFTLQSDAPVLVSDLRTEQRFHGSPLLVRHGVVSGMSCLIRGSSKSPWGLLGVHSTRPLQFTQDDLNFLVVMANILGDAIQRERAERSLRESEERFARFMQHLPGLAWIKDPAGRYVYANDAATQVFCRTRDELYGRTDEEIFPEPIAAQFKANDQVALAGGTGVQVVEDLKHPDGAVHHSIVSKFSIPGPDGQAGLVGGMAVDITDRIRAEEALVRSEAKYRGIFEGAAVSLWEEDFSGVQAAIDELRATGATDLRDYCRTHPEFVSATLARIRILDVNDSTVKLFRAADKAELVGALPKIFPPEARPVLIEEILLVAEGRTFMEGETVLQTVRGEPLNVLFTMTVAPGAAAYDRVLFSVVDITQRKQTERAWQESEQRFRMIADNISALAWTADERGAGTWYNKQWYDYAGWTAEELYGKGWDGLQHPDHRHRVNRTLKEAMRRHEPWEDTFPLRGRDGQYRWFLSRAVPIFDDRGGILRWFGTHVDITELREAQQSAIQLAAIVESSQDAILSKSPDGIIQTWNHGAELVFGYSAAEAVGQPVAMLVPPERRAAEQDILERQLRGEAILNFETTRVRKDGTLIDVSLSLSPLRNRRGAIVGISKIIRDITDKKRAERELERALAAAESANRAKDDFLAALSHELRTPLMPVMFTISVLQQDAGLPANLRASLAVVRRNIEIQSRMINDLLDLSRIRANRLELLSEVTDLHVVITRAYEVCRGHAKFPDLKIELHLAADQHHVCGDPDRLQQVFWNLLQNAMKFTPAGGRIQVHSGNRGKLLRVQVSDSGRGIDPAELTKIFEPFEQGGRKSKEALQGLGLGLAISKRIIAAHHGNLTAASQGSDRGAVFTIELETVKAPPDGSPPVECQPEITIHTS